MRISDWSSDVCSSDLANIKSYRVIQSVDKALVAPVATGYQRVLPEPVRDGLGNALRNISEPVNFLNFLRSEEHTSELQSLMRISYAVFCLKKKKKTTTNIIPYLNL